MSITLPELVVPFGYDNSKLKEGVNNATGLVSKLAGGLAAIGGTVVLGGIALAGAGLAGLAALTKDAISAAMESQEIQAQLNAVLESTGHAANLTAKQVNDMATELSKLTRFEDDAIVEGQNLLLTFTNIKDDVFPQVTELMLDMSTAMKQDMKTSAIQLGKALNDPMNGLTALTRVGVTFTEEQKNMVKQLQLSGDVAGAQAIILQELQREFGGSAEAAGKTFAGQLDILKNKLGNIKEDLGTAFLPVLSQLADGFNRILESPVVQQRLGQFLGWVQDVAKRVEENLPTIIDNFQNFIDRASEFINKMGEFRDKVKEFLDEAKDRFASFREDAEPEFTAIESHWAELVENSKELWQELMDLLGISISKDFPTLEEVATTALQAIDLLVYATKRGVELLTDAVRKLKEQFDKLPSDFTPRYPGLRTVPGFANGGDFIVPPGYSNDSFLMGVSSGERVQVTPSNQRVEATLNESKLYNVMVRAFRDGMLQADRGR